MQSEHAPPNFARDIWRGLGLTLLLHLLQVPFGFLSQGVSFALFGLSQGIYIAPAIVVAATKNRPGIIIGLLLGAGLTFLLNAATCMGLLYLFSKGH